MKPIPHPTEASTPFWTAAKDGHFMLQSDPRAGRHQFFPRPLSLFGSGALEWQEAKGTGVVVAETMCQVPGPGFADEVPYLVGLVRLDEGPRVFAPIVNVGRTAVGRRVRLTWRETEIGLRLFAFEPAADLSGR